MGSLRVNGSTSGYVELSAPAVAGSTSLTLPLTGFGKVLQVVACDPTTVSQQSITSTTKTDVNNLTVTITPSSSSSKVLVIAAVPCNLYRANGDLRAELALLRGSTSIATAILSNTAYLIGSGTNSTTSTLTMVRLDSPATTSATTYKIQGSVDVALDSQTLRVPYSPGTSALIAIEIGP